MCYALPVFAQDLGDLFGDESDTTTVDSTAAEGSGPGRRGASSDSLNARLLRTLHPSYSTDYRVDRQTTNWGQNFTFGSKIGFFNFENKTTFNIRTDRFRDQTVRDGSNATTLLFLKIPLNATLHLARYSLERPEENRSNDDVKLAFSTRDLRRNVLGVSHTLLFSGGLSHRGDENPLQHTKTTDNGLDASGGWRANWKQKRWLTLDGSIDLSRTQKNSKIEKDTTTVSSPTANINRRFDFKAHVEPFVWLATDLGANTTITDDESYLANPVRPGQPASSQLEHRSTNHRLFTARFSLFPNFKSFNVGFDITKDLQDLGYRIREEFAYTSDKTFWQGNVKADWLKTKMEFTLSGNLDENARRTSPKQDTYNNIFEGKLSRRMSSKFNARFNWQVRANKYYFADQGLDRDELRTKIQPTLAYNPNKKWAVSLTYIGATSRRIEVNPAHALQTLEEHDYTVDMGINYHLSEATHLSQIYSIKALYTTFDYNPVGDRLLSTQRITSTLDTRLGARCDFNLQYVFTLQDSGPFRVQSDGTRIFARDLRKYRQDLNASLKYHLTSWATMLVDSGFLRTDDVNEFNDTRNVNRNITLRTGVDVEKTLRGSVNLKASCQYNQSNVQDAYWSIMSGLKKDF